MMVAAGMARMMNVRNVAALLIFTGVAAPVSAAPQLTVTNNSQTPPRVAIYKKPVVTPTLQSTAPKPAKPPKHP